MAVPLAVPDSFSDAKDVFKDSLINLPMSERVNHQIIQNILRKHPDLVNCEYKQEIFDRTSKLVDFGNKQEMEFYGSPLLLASEQRGQNEGKFPTLLTKFMREDIF